MNGQDARHDIFWDAETQRLLLAAVTQTESLTDRLPTRYHRTRYRDILATSIQSNRTSCRSSKRS